MVEEGLRAEDQVGGRQASKSEDSCQLSFSSRAFILSGLQGKCRAFEAPVEPAFVRPASLPG